jgi:hypothetical protein
VETTIGTAQRRSSRNVVVIWVGLGVPCLAAIWVGGGPIWRSAGWSVLCLGLGWFAAEGLQCRPLPEWVIRVCAAGVEACWAAGVLVEGRWGAQERACIAAGVLVVVFTIVYLALRARPELNNIRLAGLIGLGSGIDGFSLAMWAILIGVTGAGLLVTLAVAKREPNPTEHLQPGVWLAIGTMFVVAVTAIGQVHGSVMIRSG